MTPSELVGQRIKDARQAKNMTQVQLGEALQGWLGKAWSRQTVSYAEAGRRDFTAAELVALASCLQKPLGYFFTSPEPKEPVEFPSGAEVPAWSLLAIVYALESTEPLSEQSQMLMLQTARDVASSLEKASELQRRAEQGADLIVQLAQGLPVVKETEQATRSRRTKKGGTSHAKK